jgi:hypothetical protein
MVIETRRRSLVGPIMAAVVIAAVVVVAIVVLSDDDSSSAKNDVAVRSCTVAPGGGRPTAAGEIVNHSSKTSNYVVRIRFLDAQGNRVSEGATAVNDVGRAETAQWQLTGVRNTANGPVRCEISGVTRTHLPGQ